MSDVHSQKEKKSSSRVTWLSPPSNTKRMCSHVIRPFTSMLKWSSTIGIALDTRPGTQPRSLAEDLLTAESVQGLLYQRGTDSFSRNPRKVQNIRWNRAELLQPRIYPVAQKALFHCDFPDEKWERLESISQLQVLCSVPLGESLALSGSLVSPKGGAWIGKP